MIVIRRALGHIPLDPFLLLLVLTVALATVLPARGSAVPWVEHGVTTAIAALFLLYGARLAPAAIGAGLGHWRLQALVFSSTFVLFPLIGIGLGLWLRQGRWLPADAVTGLTYLCLLPSTVQSSIAFTAIARGNVPAALCSASLSNVLGVVLTPLWVSQLLPAASGGFSLHGLLDIARQILLPFVVGQLLRPWLGSWLSRHARLAALVDRGSVLVVVYAAFSAGVVAGIWKALTVGSLAGIFGIDLAVLALVILVTMHASRRLGFSTEDEIAVLFCGSKKGMVGGIPMATVLFPGHSVGLIVLPLMLFHQAQLFVCATLARRYARRSERPAPPEDALPARGDSAVPPARARPRDRSRRRETALEKT